MDSMDFLGLSLIPLWYVGFLFLAFALNWLALLVLLLGDEEAIAARAARQATRPRLRTRIAAAIFNALPPRLLTVPPVRSTLAPLLTLLVLAGRSDDDEATIQ